MKIVAALVVSTVHGLRINDPCVGRTDDVPCLLIPKCDSLSFEASGSFGDFKVSDADGDVPAQQATSGTICHDGDGIHVHEVATEEYVFSPYSHCNDEVYVNSDVLEVFIAPVLSVTDNPIWYYELDSAPTGAMWGGLIDNEAKGNSSTCVSENGCESSGTLPCEGVASFAHNMTVVTTSGTGYYTTSLFIPWEIFSPEFQPTSPTTRDDGLTPQKHMEDDGLTTPWATWRLNFYR
jgi:hypothetical protein